MYSLCQVREEFTETVDMSTYLVAFVVCDFVSISKSSQRGVNVSVIASEDKIGQAGFALDSAADIMDFYHDFFGVPYPLPKQGEWKISSESSVKLKHWHSMVLTTYFEIYFSRIRMTNYDRRAIVQDTMNITLDT